LSVSLFIDRPDHRAAAARAIAAGDIVATAFGNFYAIVAEPSAGSVRAVNAAKGRPAGQVGSVTAPADRVLDMLCWDHLAPADARRLRAAARALTAAGPIGLRGPAPAHLPPHLTQPQDGVPTVQVISPGAACPANDLFARAAAGHLFVTSANRSRHRTGAAEEPAHWTAAGIAADFAHVPGFTVIAHRHEARARAAHPLHLPMSVTLVSIPLTPYDPVVLTVERHGSLHVGDVRAIAAPHGVEVRLGPAAGRRLSVRSYDPAPAG
jgi:tRNA A37 threonylcarbamoyladenosine synthetase subunit TsaC/SUA5/YrdC